MNLSLALIHGGQAVRAEKTAKEGLLAYPDHADLLGNLLIAQQHQGELPEALGTASRLLELRRDVHSLEEVAALQAGIGRELVERDYSAAAAYFWDALKLLQEAKERNPRFQTARVSLVATLIELGLVDEAMAEIEELRQLEVDRYLVPALTWHGARCLDLAAEHRACKDFCDKWLEALPGDVNLQRIRAETIVDGFCIGHERNGERIVERSSLEFFESIVQDTERRRPTDYSYLARLKEWMGDLSAARRLLTEAAEPWPEFWGAPYDFALLELRAGNHRLAEQLARDAIRLAPWRPQPWRAIAQVLERMGRASEAGAATRRAEEIGRHRSALQRGERSPFTGS